MHDAVRGVLVGIVAALALAGPAQARWLRAETDRFVIYGDTGEAALRAFTTKLTTYDRILRAFNPTAKDRQPATKVQVFLLNSRPMLKRVQPGLPDGTAGFYSAMNEGVFAFAVKESGLGEDDVLYHEYAHHFMLENFPSAYPAWFVEGWAEYFMTTEIDGAKVKVGGFNPARAYGIFNLKWLPLEQVLSQTTGETREARRDVYYAQAWLLMHYMRSDPTRAAQLDKAILAISQGEPPVKAFEVATGQSMAQITEALRKYRRLQNYEMTLKDAAPPSITVTSMPESADDLLLDNQRLLLSSTGRLDAAFLAGVRRKAAKYPGDGFAERTLARAEFVMGDVAVGEAIMKRRIEAYPGDLEDMLLAGTGQILAGMRDRPQREARYRAARPLLAKAYQLDKRDFRTLYAYGLSRSLEESYPTENDLTVLLEARALAPAVTELSARAGMALLKKGRREEAVRVLATVLNNPHGGRAAAQMRDMLSGKLTQIGEIDLEPADESEETKPET